MMSFNAEAWRDPEGSGVHPQESELAFETHVMKVPVPNPPLVNASIAPGCRTSRLRCACHGRDRKHELKGCIKEARVSEGLGPARK